MIMQKSLSNLTKFVFSLRYIPLFIKNIKVTIMKKHFMVVCSLLSISCSVSPMVYSDDCLPSSYYHENHSYSEGDEFRAGLLSVLEEIKSRSSVTYDAQTKEIVAQYSVDNNYQAKGREHEDGTRMYLLISKNNSIGKIESWQQHNLDFLLDSYKQQSNN